MTAAKGLILAMPVLDITIPETKNQGKSRDAALHHGGMAENGITYVCLGFKYVSQGDDRKKGFILKRPLDIEPIV